MCVCVKWFYYVVTFVWILSSIVVILRIRWHFKHSPTVCTVLLASNAMHNGINYLLTPIHPPHIDVDFSDN